MGRIKDFMAKLKCSDCDRVNYYAQRNKKKVKEKLTMSKYCKWCKKHTDHIESK